MRLSGWSLLVLGLLLCATIAWAAIGFFMMGFGLLALLAAEDRNLKSGRTKDDSQMNSTFAVDASGSVSFEALGLAGLSTVDKMLRGHSNLVRSPDDGADALLREAERIAFGQGSSDASFSEIALLAENQAEIRKPLEGSKTLHIVASSRVASARPSIDRGLETTDQPKRSETRAQLPLRTPLLGKDPHVRPIESDFNRMALEKVLHLLAPPSSENSKHPVAVTARSDLSYLLEKLNSQPSAIVRR